MTLLTAFQQIAQSEIDVLNVAIPLCESDSRQGFHPDPHQHMVSPELMHTKRHMLHDHIEQ